VVIESHPVAGFARVSQGAISKLVTEAVRGNGQAAQARGLVRSVFGAVPSDAAYPLLSCGAPLTGPQPQCPAGVAAQQGGHHILVA
jgi:hypothetical protein